MRWWMLLTIGAVSTCGCVAVLGMEELSLAPPMNADSALDVTESGDDADTGVDDSAPSDADATAEPTKKYTTRLTAGQVVPPGTSTATGTAECVLAINSKRLNCTVTHNVIKPTFAGVHVAPFGVDGGVHETFADTMSPISSEFALADTGIIELGRGGWHILIRSEGFPGGDIRGQLVGEGETLYGALLAPIAGTARGGIALMRSRDGMLFRYYGSIVGLSGSATDAHIHDHNDGATVSNLLLSNAMPTSTDFEGDIPLAKLGGSVGVAKLDTGSLETGYFVDVHTTLYPTGEARGTFAKIFVAP